MNHQLQPISIATKAKILDALAPHRHDVGIQLFRGHPHVGMTLALAEYVKRHRGSVVIVQTKRGGDLPEQN